MTVLTSKALKDRDVPAGAVNVFGVPVKVNGEWCLLAARFLSVNKPQRGQNRDQAYLPHLSQSRT